MNTSTAEPPVNVETPAVSSNSDEAVAQRFREQMASAPEDQRPKSSPHYEKKEEAKVEAKKEAVTDDGIPAELLSDAKPEPKDEYDELMGEELKGQVKHENFKKLKEASAKKVEALRKELEETRGKLPKDDYVPEKTAKELEKLQKQLQEREELIQRKYVEESPTFKERFSAKKESIVNRLNKAAKDFELPERTVKGLLATDSVKERSELLEESGLGTVAISSVTAILDQLDTVEAERTEFLSDWKTRAVEMEEQSKRQQDSEKAKIKAYEDKAFDEVLGELSKKTAFSKIEGNESWNRGIEEDIEKARGFMEGSIDFTNPHVAAEWALSAARSVRVHAMLDNVIGKYKAVAKELAELKAAGPASPNAGADKHDPTANMTADERAAHTFNALRGLAQNGR